MFWRALWLMDGKGRMSGEEKGREKETKNTFPPKFIFHRAFGPLHCLTCPDAVANVYGPSSTQLVSYFERM